MGFTQANLPYFKVFIMYRTGCELQNCRIKLGNDMVLDKYHTHWDWQIQIQELATFHSEFELNWPQNTMNSELECQEYAFNEV